jgi:hypothetical protein
MGQAAKALAVGQTILTMLAFLLSCAPATAGARGNGARGERERDAILHGTRLYEVTETVHFGGDGLHVVTRDAVAVLMGFAPLGTPLCPMKALITNPTAQTCTVTGTGQDSVSAGGDSVDGKGPVSGTFAVVVNAPGNSSVHVPDLPLLTGTFSGVNDLSPRYSSRDTVGEHSRHVQDRRRSAGRALHGYFPAAVRVGSPRKGQGARR